MARVVVSSSPTFEMKEGSLGHSRLKDLEIAVQLCFSITLFKALSQDPFGFWVVVVTQLYRRPNAEDFCPGASS